MEGSDCTAIEYPNCHVENPHWIGNGKCDGGNYNTELCGFDGNDCNYFNQNYSDCKVENPKYIGNGFCNGGEYNIGDCSWDGGDCLMLGLSKPIYYSIIGVIGVLFLFCFCLQFRKSMSDNDKFGVSNQKTLSPGCSSLPFASRAPIDRHNRTGARMIRNEVIMSRSRSRFRSRSRSRSRSSSSDRDIEEIFPHRAMYNFQHEQIFPHEHEAMQHAPSFPHEHREMHMPYENESREF